MKPRNWAHLFWLKTIFYHHVLIYKHQRYVSTGWVSSTRLNRLVKRSKMDLQKSNCWIWKKLSSIYIYTDQELLSGINLPQTQVIRCTSISSFKFSNNSWYHFNSYLVWKCWTLLLLIQQTFLEDSHLSSGKIIDVYGQGRRMWLTLTEWTTLI